ncbi:hypothetical protein MD484_g8345, partial [Candolleomyces efflorescens]
MTDNKHSGGGIKPGSSNNNTPTSSRPATPGAEGHGIGFKAWARKKYDKGKAKMERGEEGFKKLFDRGKPKGGGDVEKRPQEAGGSGPDELGGNASATGNLGESGEATATSGIGAVEELTAGAPATKSPASENVLGTSNRAEAGQEGGTSPQLRAPFASAAKDDHTPSPEAVEADVMTGLKGALAVFGPTGSGIPHDDDPLTAAEVSEMDDNAEATHGADCAFELVNPASGPVPLFESPAMAGEMAPDTTSGAIHGASAETVPVSTPVDDYRAPLLAAQPQATPASGAEELKAPASPAVEGGTHAIEDALVGLPPLLSGAVGKAENEPESAAETKSSKIWAIAKGSLKAALVVAAKVTPEPFKGAAEAFLGVVDVVEKTNSNKEEMELLEKRCDLLGLSILNAVKEKDGKPLSEDLKDSIGRLVLGIWDTLKAAIREKATGVASYVLFEADADVLKNTNKRLNELLQCFWIENQIAGIIIVNEILSIAQDQALWMQNWSVAHNQHFKFLLNNSIYLLPGHLIIY